MQINNLTIRPNITKDKFIVVAPNKRILEEAHTEDYAVAIATEILDFCSPRYIKTLIKREVKRLGGWIENNKEANFSNTRAAANFEIFCDSRSICCSGIGSGYKRWYVTFEVK